MKHNGPDAAAFPCGSDGGRFPPSDGMTMREWYASAALVGILARGQGHSVTQAADWAFRQADAMMERAQKPPDAPLAPQEA